ncbi:sensor histidine kinase [Hymenobacter glaciei]|uniref:sensor histidine kinase n=1 Tax=Hymenobacter glaciei TaxID=877209 RepID=UPI0031F05229
MFSPTGFPARWVCGQWTPFHGWLYILSSLAIWLAYFAIPGILYYFLHKRKRELPFTGLFWLFIAFIFACGLTHLADSVMFWLPAYRVSALLLLVTAVVSWATVIALFRVLPKLLALQTPAQVEALLQQRFETLTAELQQSEERQQFALASGQLGVWDWDVAGNKVFFSKRWKEMLGYADSEIESDFAEWHKRVHPDDKDPMLREVERHMAGETPPYRTEYRMRCKDGNYKWIGTAGMVTQRSATGAALRLVGTHEDIHAQKVFQEMLRLSESTFSSAFHFSGIGIAFVTPTGGWADVNPALCQLLGYSRAEFLKLTFQDITHPDDLEVDLGYVRQMLAKEINTYKLEKRYIHKNGQFVWALLTVSLVWGTDDVPQFFISQIVDITQTKHLIGALERNNEALHIGAVELESKLGQLEEFNNIVAHNLRGPAGNLQALLGLLPKSVPDIGDNKVYQMLNQASSNLQATLGELMQVLQVRLNKEIPFEDCEVARLLATITVALGVQMAEKKAVIEQDLRVPVIHYPKIYLDSILYNLVSNALKYTHPTRRPVIKVSTHLDDGQLVLTVQDNGLGIDLAKYGGQVFKLHKVFHAGFDSRGVGLFMTKNQIETLGGKISVASVPGEGAAFSVRF